MKFDLMQSHLKKGVPLALGIQSSHSLGRMASGTDCSYVIRNCMDGSWRALALGSQSLPHDSVEVRDFASRRLGLHFFLGVVPEQPGAVVIVFHFHDGVVS